MRQFLNLRREGNGTPEIRGGIDGMLFYDACGNWGHTPKN